MDDIDPAFADVAFCHRVTCYLEGSLDEQELRLLSGELVEDPRKRAVFAQMCMLRAALQREGSARRTAGQVAMRRSGESFFDHPVEPPDQLVTDQDAGVAADADVGSMSLEDAVILPALTDSPEDEIPESITMPSMVQPVQSPARKAWWLSGLSGAAILLIAFLIWALRPSTPNPAPVAINAPTQVLPTRCATVTASAAGMSDNSQLIKPGTALQANDLLNVGSGGVELRLAQGAIVVVTGPAQVRIVDGNSIKLSKGEIVARVPVRAHGFKATGPGANVVDLGTEFGLRVDKGGTGTDLCVLKGSVRATGLDGKLLAVGRPRVITADHALHYDQADAASPQPRAFNGTTFNRSIEQVRLPVSTHGTGQGVQPGAVDPAWKSVSIPGDGKWKPRPVYRVSQLRPDYTANTPEAGWIAIDANSPDVVPGEYVYETSIDLTGFDPSTVQLSFVVAVDDYIKAFEVNGTLAEFPPDDVASHDAALRTLSFTSHAWHAGLNRVDVIVVNRDDGATIGRNPTGLLLSWHITACPVVKR